MSRLNREPQPISRSTLSGQVTERLAAEDAPGALRAIKDHLHQPLVSLSREGDNPRISATRTRASVGKRRTRKKK